MYTRYARGSVTKSVLASTPDYDSLTAGACGHPEEYTAFRMSMAVYGTMRMFLIGLHYLA